MTLILDPPKSVLVPSVPRSKRLSSIRSGSIPIPGTTSCAIASISTISKPVALDKFIATSWLNAPVVSISFLIISAAPIASKEVVGVLRWSGPRGSCESSYAVLTPLDVAKDPAVWFRFGL